LAGAADYAAAGAIGAAVGARNARAFGTRVRLGCGGDASPGSVCEAGTGANASATDRNCGIGNDGAFACAGNACATTCQ
jgi:hypothetical protein